MKFMAKIQKLAAQVKSALSGPRTRLVVAGVVGIIIGFVASSALASSGTLSFTRPAVRTDGTPLAASDIASYLINCTYKPTGGVAAPCVGLTPASFAGTSLGGVVAFTVTASGDACFTLQTKDTGNLVGPTSNIACKVVTVSPPNPPGNVVVAFNVTINGELVSIDPVPVFEVRQNGKHQNKVAGFALAGTPCTGDRLFIYRGQNYYRVTRENVGWWATMPSDNAAAPCS